MGVQLIGINTNTQSIFAQRVLGQNTKHLSNSIEKISTGKRINRAADDAAGLSISQKLEAKVRGEEQAKKNIGDGISMLQTGEGGLAQVQDNLQRIRELMVQAANGTNSTNELDAIQREINSRVTTIDDIAHSTTYNDRELLLGLSIFFGGNTIYYGDRFDLQSGSDNGNTTEINTHIEIGGLNPNGTGAIVDINWDPTILGAFSGGQMVENSSVALARLRVAGATVASQDGTAVDGGTIDDLDQMIDNISTMRSKFGSLQNSLESRLDYLDVSIENNLAAKSRIMDADIANESAQFAKHQILQNSAAAMLSQANASPQIALNLLP